MRRVQSCRANSNYSGLDTANIVVEGYIYQRNDISGLCGKFMGQFLIEGNKVGNVNIAVVLLHKHILP